jgi:hypothetical protein
LYRGADPERKKECPATAFPVLKLSKNVNLHNKNHIMYVDNWFMSFYLVFALLSMGFHVCGTLRTNRVCKRAGIDKNWFIKGEKFKRGEMKGKIIRKGNKKLYLTTWKDNKPVNMLATWPAYKEEAERNTKSKDSKGYAKIKIIRPTHVRYYNKGMGGTDGFDASIARYRIYLSTKRWPHRVILHFLNASIINAHILFKLTQKIDRKHESYTKLGFMTKLMTQILSSDVATKASAKLQKSDRSKSQSTSVIPRLSTLRHSEIRLEGQHFGCAVPMSNKSDRFKGQMYCRWPGCNTRTRGFCMRCNIPLCLTLVNNTTCFEKFHTVTSLPKS